MFGQNPKLPPEKGCGTSLKVTNIFYTLQGEGPNAGHPAVFIRLSGCNLACHFCDTEFNTYQLFSIHKILEEVNKLSKGNTNFIVITGGEPFRQNINLLCSLLITNGYRIQIETNGTIYRDIPEEVEIVCSPKFTKSLKYNINPKFFNHKFAFKFLVSSEDKNSIDLDFYQNYIDSNKVPIYVQPMDVYDENKNIANLKYATKLAMQGGFRLSIQMHKILEIE